MYINGKETVVNTYDVIAIVSGISGFWTTNKLYKKSLKTLDDKALKSG